MDYPYYRFRGWLIDSGHAEAVCKTKDRGCVGAKRRQMPSAVCVPCSKANAIKGTHSGETHRRLDLSTTKMLNRNTI